MMRFTFVKIYTNTVEQASGSKSSKQNVNSYLPNPKQKHNCGPRRTGNVLASPRNLREWEGEG